MSKIKKLFEIVFRILSFVCLLAIPICWIVVPIITFINYTQWSNSGAIAGSSLLYGFACCILCPIFNTLADWMFFKPHVYRGCSDDTINKNTIHTTTNENNNINVAPIIAGVALGTVFSEAIGNAERSGWERAREFGRKNMLKSQHTRKKDEEE